MEEDDDLSSATDEEDDDVAESDDLFSDEPQPAKDAVTIVNAASVMGRVKCKNGSRKM